MKKPIQEFKIWYKSVDMVSLEETSYITQHEEGSGTAWQHPWCVPFLLLYM